VGRKRVALVDKVTGNGQGGERRKKDHDGARGHGQRPVSRFGKKRFGESSETGGGQAEVRGWTLCLIGKEGVFLVLFATKYVPEGRCLLGGKGREGSRQNMCRAPVTQHHDPRIGKKRENDRPSTVKKGCGVLKFGQGD